MYRDYFGFKERPFGLTPDTRFVFLSDNHKEGFAHLWYGLKQGGGFIVLTGEVGTGKTTLLRTLLARLNSERWRSALIFNPPFSPIGLFREILRELGLPSDDRDPNRLMRVLNTYLLRENAAGRSVLLILDEAQNLRPEILEKIRLLSNLETERRKLLHIVLAGQPELGGMLDRQELRQLRQRVSVHYHLRSMDAADTGHYVEHRLKRAGWGENPLFTSRALHKIYRVTGGIPRMINILCDRCLLRAFVSNRKNVTSTMVRKAVSEMKTSRRRFSPFWNSSTLRVLAFVLVLGWPCFWALTRDSRPESTSPSVFFADVLRRNEATASDFPRPSEETGVSRPEEMVVEAAFDALAGAWQVPKLSPGENVLEFRDVWEAAKARGLEVRRVRGSLTELLALGYPVMLEVRGVDGIKVITVLEEKQGKVRVVPPIDNQSWLSHAQLARLWGEDAFLFWRNERGLPEILPIGSRGPEVKALQELLFAAGENGIRIDGIYGRETGQALRTFQLRQGLEPDENLGMATLLRLYQMAEKSGAPKLREG